MWHLGSSAGKESACIAGDPGSIPGSGRSTGEGIGYPLQYSWASLWLSWQRIHLQCERPRFSLWVGKIPWRRERLPTPAFWPGEFHGLYSPWDGKESDTTERLSLPFTSFHFLAWRSGSWTGMAGPARVHLGVSLSIWPFHVANLGSLIGWWS